MSDKLEILDLERKLSNNVILKYWHIICLFLIVLLSFILDIYALLQYEASYGVDGAYYDMRVAEVLKTGYPDSNDPPLVYYYLVPFVVFTGDSHLGIKLGMSLISSLIAIPAYLLTEQFSEKTNVESKIPALLSSFLITINIYYLRMIEDFMQNLVGTFFLLWLLYYSAKWFEDFQHWKKYGIITGIFLICNIATHIYTGSVAVVLFSSLFLFNIIIKSIKNKALPIFELKILGLLIGAIIGTLIPLIYLYPTIYTNFSSRISSYSQDFFTESTQFNLYFLMFLTVPFILGLATVLYIWYNGVKQTTTEGDRYIISKKTFLSWLYINLAILIIVLVLIPSNWQNRFILLCFVPIALIVPIGIKHLETWLSLRYDFDKKKITTIIGIISLIFCISSLVSVLTYIPNMGPTITDGQYDELEEIKAEYMPDDIDPDGIMQVGEFGLKYWVEYILEMDTGGGDINDTAEENEGKEIYFIRTVGDEESPFSPNIQTPWNPLLPYSPFTQGTLPSQSTREPQSDTSTNTRPRPRTSQDDGPGGYIANIPNGIVLYEGEHLEVSLIYLENGSLALA